MLYEFLGGLNVFITKESKIVDNKVFCSATPLPKKKTFFAAAWIFLIAQKSMKLSYKTEQKSSSQGNKS